MLDQKIETCLQLSTWAYRPDRAPPGMRRIATLEGGDSFALLAQTKHGTGVAFRGSDPALGDWIDDLDARWQTARGGPGAVHRGFQRALDRIWPAVRSAAVQHGPLLLTGHSLGGALALLAAARLPSLHVHLVCTFGAPRVGNSAFVARLAQIPTVRVVATGDPVSQVPPYLLGFRHAGTLLQLTSEGVHHAPPPQRRVQLWARAWWDALRGDGPDPLQRHGLATYRRWLNRSDK